MSQLDYFGGDAELSPLLHTWSLAVEEQYYFVFPLILFFLWKTKNINLGFMLLTMVLISFAFSEWAWRQNPARSFYFTFSRFWEIGIGSLCAYYLSKYSSRANDFLGLLGIGIVAFSIFYFDTSIPFPSSYTLVPLSGVVLIIVFARDETVGARILSSRFLVKFGLISYSAYLWHQPLFAFARIRLIESPSIYTIGLLCVLTFVVAWISWRFVETPFRRRDRNGVASRIGIFWASLSGFIFFAIFGLIAYIKDGFITYFDPNLKDYYLAAEDRANRDCLFAKGDNINFHPISYCLHVERPGDTPRVLLIGDSHSNAISDVIGNALFEHGIPFYNVAYSGCPALPGFIRQDQGLQHECSLFAKSVYNYAESVNVSTIVLTARFPWYVDGYRFDNGEGGIEVGAPAVVDIEGFINSDLDDAGRRQRVLQAIEDQIAILASKFNVVLVYPVPEAGWSVPERAFKLARFSTDALNLTTSYDRYIQRSEDIISIFDRLVRKFPGVYAARIDDVLCSDVTERCINADRKGVYYFDDDHLSNAGARLIEGVIVDAVDLSENLH